MGARVSFFFLMGLLGLGLAAALTAGSGMAADPDRPYRAFAPGISRDAPAPPTAWQTPGPAPGGGNEINLQPELDTAHAVSQVVTVAHGATLTTTGSDGTVYTLTIPANGMLFDAVVTMSPLKGLGGLAATGGLKAGVQLEPDGMMLGLPATLDIVPASSVSVAEEISLSYSGDGRQAYAYGMSVNPTRKRFALLHFSGWAIAGGTETQRQAFFQSRVDSAVNQIAQKVAPALQAERQRQLSGVASDEGSGELMAEVQGALAEGYETVVKPAMDTAEALADSGDIDSPTPGLQAFLEWERQLQLLGVDAFQAERAALFEQMDRIIDKVRRNMLDRCVNQHDVSMGVRLMGLARQRALMTGEPGPAFDDAQRCLTFKLDFETELSLSPGLNVWNLHVRALNVPLQMGFPGNFPASQPLELVGVTGEAPENCSFSWDVHVTKPFIVHSARFISTVQDGRVEVADVELIVSIGDLAGTITWHCVTPEITYDVDFPLPDGELSGTFTVLHLDDTVGVDPTQTAFRIVNWDIIRSSLYARKTFSNSVVGISEATTFDLKHAPE